MRSVDFSKILPKGSVLVFSLLILSIMLVTSLTILSSALLDRKASLSTGSSARSFQVADSGVEEILYQVYKKNHATLSALTASITGASCSGSTVTLPIAGGTSVVSFYQDETTLYTGGCAGTDWRDAVVKIKSEGTAGTSTRAVEVAVAAGCNWSNIPLTDINNFDNTCTYRFKTNTDNTPYGVPGAAVDTYYYVNAVSPLSVIFIPHAGNISHINSNSKNSYKVNGSHVLTVTLMEKQCGC